jgi:hypothetical protein
MVCMWVAFDVKHRPAVLADKNYGPPWLPKLAPGEMIYSCRDSSLRKDDE